MNEPQARNPLHGITLEAMLNELVAHFGLPDLGQRVAIRWCSTCPALPQCDISTGRFMALSSPRVAPPITCSVQREWP